MPRLYVVFDANAYIALPKQELPALVLRERSNGVVAWASYFVVEELIARTASTDPRRAGGGIAALRRLAEHCQMYDGSYERVNFVADPRQQVAALLYGRAQFHEQRIVDTYGTVVTIIAASKSDNDWPEWVRKATVNVRTEIEHAEADFVAGMFEGVVKVFAPDAATWADIRVNAARADALAADILSDEGLDLCAGLFADELAEFVDVTPTPEERQRAVHLLKESFQLPLRIYNALMDREGRNQCEQAGDRQYRLGHATRHVDSPLEPAGPDADLDSHRRQGIRKRRRGCRCFKCRPFTF